MESTETTKSKKQRCFMCKKKFLIVIPCKCEQHFCMKHKDPETHDCSFNFKTGLCMGETIIPKKIEII
jgi:predicted nucleic acid binding AN1-type Zn finger protein